MQPAAHTWPRSAILGAQSYLCPGSDEQQTRAPKIPSAGRSQFALSPSAVPQPCGKRGHSTDKPSWRRSQQHQGLPWFGKEKESPSILNGRRDAEPSAEKHYAKAGRNTKLKSLLKFYRGANNNTTLVALTWRFNKQKQFVPVKRNLVFGA